MSKMALWYFKKEQKDAKIKKLVKYFLNRR